MEKLDESLLVEILSRLDDSADVARCRVAYKPFNTVSPYLRSINLQSTLKSYIKLRPRVSNSSNSSNFVKPFKSIFLDIISNLRVVESIYIGIDNSNDMYLTDDDFVTDWMPRLSDSLKSLSISDFSFHYGQCQSTNVLPLLYLYCHNLLELKLKYARLNLDNLNPMPKLTSLTLEFTRLKDEDLNELNSCFPNLHVLNLIGVRGLWHPKIQFFNLKTCHISGSAASLTLITPNLFTLRIECRRSTALHVEAPLLSHFHLALNHAETFTVKKFENLKTLQLEALDTTSLLLKFPITKTVENLTVNSLNETSRAFRDSVFNLEKVFTILPNVSSLCIKSGAWSEIEKRKDPFGWETLHGRKGLKTFCAYLSLVDPSLTFSYIACVLDQCIGLTKVSLLIHNDYVGNVSNSFMSKCMVCWPRLKWRWGFWSEEMEDSWIADGISH